MSKSRQTYYCAFISSLYSTSLKAILVSDTSRPTHCMQKVDFSTQALLSGHHNDDVAKTAQKNCYRVPVTVKSQVMQVSQAELPNLGSEWSCLKGWKIPLNNLRRLYANVCEIMQAPV